VLKSTFMDPRLSDNVLNIRFQRPGVASEPSSMNGNAVNWLKSASTEKRSQQVCPSRRSRD